MPYQTGTINNFDELRSDIAAFLLGNGWSAEGNIFKKNGVYALLTSDGTNYLQLEGGKGSDGSGNLVGKHDGPVSWRNNAGHLKGEDYNGSVAWPITYYLHLESSPVDEFWCFLEYNGGSCQHMGFGNIVKAAAFPGGGFYCSSFSSGYMDGNAYLRLHAPQNVNGGGYSSVHGSFIPFHGVRNGNVPNRSGDNFDGCCVHAEVAGFEWYSSTQTTYWGGSGSEMLEGWSMLEERSRSLSLINGNVTLVPFRLFGRTPNNNRQRIGTLKNIRFTRNDNFNFGQVESDGTDSWKIYPVWVKNSSERNGNSDGGYGHSGTFALAVRYDGP